MKSQWAFTPKNYQSPGHYRPTSPQVYHSSSVLSPTPSPSHVPQPWLLDTGASHYVAQDLQTLSLHSEYDGTEEIVVGNGKKLRITTLVLPCYLSNILFVPDMTRNLRSVSKFSQTNTTFVEFLPHVFVVKDIRTILF